jgi:3-hydroxy-9,10-secoandrosta-1,3,5(10)-triene-9,17-dione monooxygenase reductase component
VVTARPDDGPVGLAVGSFCSVSLDPALVGFFPAATSSSWPGIEAAGSFCVNILAEDQEDVCRRFATKGVDKFEGLGWRPASSGAPLLDGVLAWIDCDLHSVTEAGDHWCVLGRVRELAVARETGPLVFYRGGYGRFAV